MKIRELAKACQERHSGEGCFECPHQQECDRMTETLKDVTPIGLIAIIDNNEDI